MAASSYPLYSAITQSLVSGQTDNLRGLELEFTETVFTESPLDYSSPMLFVHIILIGLPASVLASEVLSRYVLDSLQFVKFLQTSKNYQQKISDDFEFLRCGEPEYSVTK
ncbi:hypothetical protein ACTXT7_001263 [Hymenolepis weldensis]